MTIDGQSFREDLEQRGRGIDAGGCGPEASESACPTT
jgi:hypothetical protein